MKITKFSLLILSFLIFQPLQAGEQLILGGQDDGKYMGHKLEYLEDPEAKLTIDDIILKTSEFSPIEAETPNFGFSPSAYWFRFDAVNEQATDVSWFLEFSYPMLDRIEVYIPDGLGGFNRKIQGDHLPFGSREISYRNFIFTMEEPANSRQTYYFRVHTSSSVDIPLRSWSAIGLSKKINQEQTTLGGFVGIMVIMLAYNFFLFFSVGDRSYIYYVLFVGSYTLFQLVLSGLAFEHIWPNQIWWANTSLPLLLGFSIVTAVQFARSFLNIVEKSLRLNQIMLISMGATTVISLASLALNYSLAIKITTAVALINVLMLSIIGAYFIKQSYRPAYYYMIAWSAFFVGAMLFIFKTFGILPDNFITSWSIQIGSVLEVMLLSLGLGYRYNILKQEREEAEHRLIEGRLKMFNSVSRFVPNQFITFLEKESIMDVGLGDAVEKHMSIFFCDIRRFTNLSENMGVDDNFRFLNSYLSRMGPIIHNHGGFIDKFIGDAIMALFPVSADDALQASIQVRHELKRYNEVRQEQGFNPIDVGIGLNTGNVMLGTVGSDLRLNTTVIGDSVNLAARVEELTKTFKIPLLISEYTYANLADPSRYNLRLIDRVRVRGKEHPIKIYESFDANPEEIRLQKIESLDILNEATIAYCNGEFSLAAELFQKCLTICPEDPIPTAYLKRCEKLIANPPGEKWRGVSRVR